MHMFDTFATEWQRTNDHQSRLRRAPGGFDDWPHSRRSGLRHPVTPRSPE